MMRVTPAHKVRKSLLIVQVRVGDKTCKDSVIGKLYHQVIRCNTTALVIVENKQDGGNHTSPGGSCVSVGYWRLYSINSHKLRSTRYERVYPPYDV